MYGIELQLKQTSRVIRKKGRPVSTCPQTQAIAVIRKDGSITEITSSCDASTLVREIARRFGPKELTWGEASEVVRMME